MIITVMCQTWLPEGHSSVSQAQLRARALIGSRVGQLDGLEGRGTAVGKTDEKFHILPFTLLEPRPNVRQVVTEPSFAGNNQNVSETGSPIASSCHMKISSIIAASLGTTLSISRGASCPSGCANGRIGSNHSTLV
jgi:hypothetical protein